MLVSAASPAVEGENSVAQEQNSIHIQRSARVPSVPDAGEIRGQLTRMLASELFLRSDRMSRFLSFIVHEALAGNARQLDQQAVARAVFDRPSSFDPTTDPIVRVEAGRLRAKLREYYATSGLMDPVHIGMARVGYCPSFTRRDVGHVGSFSQWLDWRPMDNSLA